MKAKISGGVRATYYAPRRATQRVPSSLPSKSGGRKKASFGLPVKATDTMPSSGRRPSKSGKRGKAPVTMPVRATRAVPSSASPDPKAGGGGHGSDARKGHSANASLSAPLNGKDGQTTTARKGRPFHAFPPVPNSVTRGLRISARDGHSAIAPRPASDLAANLTADLSRVFLLYEQRRDLLATASGMTNRLKALTKIRRSLPVSAKVSEAMIQDTDYPPIDTLLLARGVLRDHLGKIESQLEKLAEELPAYASFWKPTRGLSGLGLALIVGEAGNLAEYDTHSKLWRRFGLHVGGGQAYYTKRSGMSPEAWSKAGYCPRRRSLVYQLTDSLLKGQIRKDEHDADKRIALGDYGALYLREKERQREKAKAEGLTVCAAAKIPAKDAHKYRSDGHIHNRAARYVGKKLLRDLWKVWRREAIEVLPKGHARCASRSPSTSAGRASIEVSTMASVRLPSPPPHPAA